MTDLDRIRGGIIKHKTGLLLPANQAKVAVEDTWPD